MMSHFTDMTGGLEPTQYIDKLENELLNCSKEQNSCKQRNFSECLQGNGNSNGGRPS